MLRKKGVPMHRCQRSGCEGYITIRQNGLNIGDCECGKAYFWQPGEGYQPMDYDNEFLRPIKQEKRDENGIVMSEQIQRRRERDGV